MGKQPKYPVEEYIGLDMPSDDMDTSITGFKSKLVKTRKESRCMYCGTRIAKGDYALAASGFLDGWDKKPFYIHYCIDCADEELLNFHGEEHDEEGNWREEAYQRWLKRAEESGFISKTGGSKNEEAGN